MYEYKVAQFNRKNRGKPEGFSPSARMSSLWTNFLNNESVDGWEFYCFKGFGSQAVFRRIKK